MLPPVAPCPALADTGTGLNPSGRDKMCRVVEEMLGDMCVRY